MHEPLVPLSAGDVDVLTSDVGPAPANIGLLLDLPNVGSDEVPGITEVLADRVRSVPALGRAIHREGRRRFWIDRPQLASSIQVLDVRDDAGALARAAGLLTTPLDLTAPPWTIELLVDDHGVTIVFVAHHVLTDGLHGLAMLSALADAPGHQEPPSAGPAVTRPQLRSDDRATATSRPPTAPGAPTETPPIRRRGPRLAPRTSLNRPTGPQRGIATHDVSLQAVRHAAHRSDATINDLLLVAICQAVGAELRERGEHPRELMVWVPVATAPRTDSQAANAVGVMLVPVSLEAAMPERLAQVSAYTTQHKAKARDSGSLRAAHLISQASGLLGLSRAMNQHQRIGNTSLSTMRGPPQGMQLAGHPIRRIVPAASRAANVGVNFLALSYADTLTISLVHDPDQLPDPAPMIGHLAVALDDLVH